MGVLHAAGFRVSVSNCLPIPTNVTLKCRDRSSKYLSSWTIPRQSARSRGAPSDGGGRDEIAPPKQRRGFAALIHRPHLVERQADVITAARIIEDVSSLETSVSPGGDRMHPT